MKLINASGAPEAIGPYSHASSVGDTIFCSGQIPLDPKTMKVVEGGIKAQTKQVLANIDELLKELGAKKENIAKTTMFLTEDMADFPVVNEIYAEYFGDHKPARSTVAVAALPMGCLVEIECIVSFA